MNIEEILKYVNHTPWNTNLSILKQMIDPKEQNSKETRTILDYVERNKYSMNISILQSVLDTVEVKEETGGFPIAWNSMEVLGNPSCDISGMPHVKVSDFLPTADEITGTNLALSSPDISDTSVTTIVESYGNVVVVTYTGANMVSEFYIAYEAGENDTLGVTFPESGCYSLDYGTLTEMSIDCVIDLAK